MLSMFDNLMGKKNDKTVEKSDILSVRDVKQIPELENTIRNGSVMFILVHADWCGHCQTYKPIWSELEKAPGRTAQMAMIHHDMIKESDLLKDAKIPGYPSVLKVYPDGHIEEYTEEGKKTNGVPDIRNIDSMKKELTNPKNIIEKQKSMVNKNVSNANKSRANKSTTNKTSANKSTKNNSTTNNSSTNKTRINKTSANNNLGNKRYSISQITKRNIRKTTNSIPPLTGGNPMFQALQKAGPASLLLLSYTGLTRNKTMKPRTSKKSRRTKK